MGFQLKDRNKQIPGGYRFLVAETNWDSTKVLYAMPSLRVITDALIQHRLGNPYLMRKYNWSTDPVVVENEVANFNAQICFANGWKDFITSDQPIPTPSPPSTPQGGRVVRFAASLKKTSSGIKLVTDWLGDGLQPVAKELAEKRAAVCVACPLNQEGNFWQKIDAIAAHKVKTLVAIKSDMEIKTPYDSQLKSCQACDCWNELKVQTPLDLILKNSSPEVMARLDKSCWVLSESKA